MRQDLPVARVAPVPFADTLLGIALLAGAFLAPPGTAEDAGGALPSTGNRSSFGGSDRSGSSARQSSNRGRSSAGRSSGGGGRSGGRSGGGGGRRR